MDLPEFVVAVTGKELTPVQKEVMSAVTERPKVLLIGSGPYHSRLLETLLALNIADVEMRSIDDAMIHGRGFRRLVVDEMHFPAIQSSPIRDVYEWKQEAADGLHRRKEPKGPRGRWGKL